MGAVIHRKWLYYQSCFCWYFFKLVSMEGLGIGVDRRVCLCVWEGGYVAEGRLVCVHTCMYVSEWVRGLFLDFTLLKEALFVLSASGTRGLAAGPRNKAVCSFPRRPVNKCLSQSQWAMGGEEKRGKERNVHNCDMDKGNTFTLLCCWSNPVIFVVFSPHDSVILFAY